MRFTLGTWIGIAGLTLAGTACQSAMSVNRSANLDLHLNTPTTRVFATSPNFVERSRSVVQGTKLPYGGCLEEIPRNTTNDGTMLREVEYDPKTCRSIVARGTTFIVTATSANASR